MSAPPNNTFLKQWGVLGIAFFLLGGAVVHNLYKGYRDTEAIEQQRLKTQARVVAENISNSIGATDRVLLTLRSGLRGVPPQRWSAIATTSSLKQLESLIPGVRTFLGVDSAGRIRFSNRPELVGTSVVYRDYFRIPREASGDDILFVAPPFQTVLGSWGMNLVRIIPGQDGAFGGIVAATLDPDHFTALLGSINYSGDMVSAIIHGDGLLFTMAPEWKELAGKNLALPGTLFSRHRASGAVENLYHGLFRATGDERMVALRTAVVDEPKTDKPIIVAASRSDASIFSGWRAHLRNQTLVLFSIILVSSYLLARYQQSKRVQLQQTAAANAKLRKLTHGIENSASAVMITDKNGTIEYVNRKFCQLTGYGIDEAVGQNPRILKSEATPREVFDNLWRTILSGSEWRGELLNRRKNGELYWSIASISPLRDDQGEITHFIANVEDINDRKNAEATIEHLAYYDPLTDLPNRRMLQDRLEIALKRSRRQGSGMALLYLDLDGFKHVNDNLGHPAGDRLLKEMATRYTSLLRDDDLVCRMGGDEFAVILHDVHHDEDAVVVAHRLLEQTAQPVQLDDSEVVVTASIGIALFPKNGDDTRTLEKNADIALYHAKGEGKNTFSFFDEELNSASRNRIALEQRLRQVLEKNELLVLYQPKISLATGKVTGVEALVRWNSPEFGMVSPLRFIPLAEETRMIIPIGEWVLETACRQQVLWQEQGLSLTMAVNLSSVQFKSPTLIERITAILDKTGMLAEQLELELTESALVEKPNEATWILEQLRSLGCGIAIDDFGTGYSSLAYLKNFPVTVLKIDRTFVRDLAHDSGDRAIAQSVVALANNLDMQTVAEGVEQQEQLAILRELGCAFVQGFIYSRPVPADELPAIVHTITAGDESL
ncbi:bifunctional diguanylate cyclase/phosphodiesterase [Trichlorobacter ammonificans]|uniref:Diguanylate cyclase n=1 Tax=Trichlorobacter ammonificans TaxID=2916410 RepID=A0ABM9D9F9_9BACT|nr:EAL domain-containing protein [Trichlorobacter ammonificans]CAH2031866.1 putative Diguanylate cyclase [Trichlorobacter ammonificans]